MIGFTLYTLFGALTVVLLIYAMFRTNAAVTAEAKQSGAVIVIVLSICNAVVWAGWWIWLVVAAFS